MDCYLMKIPENMKNAVKYTVAFLSGVSLLAFAGCNPLDQAPTNKFTDDTFWSSADRAQSVVNMAYNQMYSHTKFLDDEALSDNIFEQRGGPDTRTIRTGTANASTGLFESEWKWIYQGIKTCNVFMDKVDLVPDLNEDSKADMIAQIKFIRAYLYFRAVNFYGAVPFFLSDITLDQSKTSVRTPKSDIIPQLVSEIESVIPVLPSRDELSASDNGKITKAAAMVLLARIYMYNPDLYPDWASEVADICDDLIHNQAEYGTYSLFTTADEHCSAYENLFMSAYEYNSEVILDYSAMETIKQWTTFNNLAPMAVGSALIQRAPTRELVDDYLMFNGKKIDESGSGYNESDPYSNRDPRLLYTIGCHGKMWKDVNNNGAYTEYTLDVLSNESKDKFSVGSNSTPTGFFVRKYYDMGHGPEFKQWNNIIMMRYADVLLMYAEAKHALGEFDQNVWDETIRPIRERAGFSEDVCAYPSSLGSDQMQDLIRRERRCELALEGLRYYDILRWNIGSDVLNCNVRSSSETGSVILDARVFSDRDKLWSIPQSQLELVPTLLPNNPGY